MQVINEPLLAEFRAKPRCEYCGSACVVEPHHIYTRGMGGGGRLDIRQNLVSLGGPFGCACHRRHHDGFQPLTCDLLALVAARERCTQQDIKNEVNRLRRMQ